MGNNTKQVAFTVTDAQKEAIRKAAADRGRSMAELARRATLDEVRAEHVSSGPGQERPVARPDGKRDPLTDFIEAHLRRDPDADPVSKSAVYGWYTDFCEKRYPSHAIETQHKVSREIADIDGVDTGRRYLQDNPGGGDTRTRCFLNLRLADEPAGN